MLAVIDSWSHYYNRQTTVEEKKLYSHLYKCAEVESPDLLIERFRLLFIEGIEYYPSQVLRTLGKIVNSEFAQREFQFILNRSCYILINRWWQHPRLKSAIPELIALFETHPVRVAHSRTTQRLRELVRRFPQTEQYRALRHLAQLINQKHEQNSPTGSKPLSTFLNRYPCLYEHCLLTHDSTYEQRQKVRLLRDQQQWQYEIDLSRYVTYQKLDKNSLYVKNPTLLSDRQLNIALKQFTGKIDGDNSYRDLAEQFRTYSRLSPSYRAFKQEFYEYLTVAIDSKYTRGEFSQRLHKQLQNTLSQHDNAQLSEALLEATCKKMLNFMVVESSQNPKHYVFSDLTSNLGTTPTIGILMKIVLLCRQLKNYLEQRFSILFNHYETHANDTINWLVESLENLNVALSTNFGKLTLCPF